MTFVLIQQKENRTFDNIYNRKVSQENLAKYFRLWECTCSTFVLFCISSKCKYRFLLFRVWKSPFYSNGPKPKLTKIVNSLTYKTPEKIESFFFFFVLYRQMSLRNRCNSQKCNISFYVYLEYCGKTYNNKKMNNTVF